MGISPYYLSEEEIEAIRKAQDDAYKSLEKNFDELKNTKTLKVKFRPKREKYIKNEKSELSDNDSKIITIFLVMIIMNQKQK